jgi:outer membrane protein TolC
MTQKTVGLSQQLPFFGKLGLQERIAGQDVRIEALKHDRLKLDLINRIKQSYYMLWFLDRSLDITNENLVILSDLAAVTEARYRVGKGFQQDLLKTQLEELHLQQEKLDIEEKISNQRAELNAMLNRLPQEPLGKPVERPLQQLQIDLDSLQNLALSNNPDLGIKSTVAGKMDLFADLSEKEYWPDFRLSVNYGQRTDRPDFLSGLITLNLPLYAGSKQSERVQQYRLSRMVADEQKQNTRNQIFSRIKNLYDRLEKTNKLIALYQFDILPQSRQALTSAMAAYQTDQVEFVSVLLSQVQLHQNTLKYYQLLFEYHSAFSELEKVCGVSF